MALRVHNQAPMARSCSALAWLAIGVIHSPARAVASPGQLAELQQGQRLVDLRAHRVLQVLPSGNLVPIADANWTVEQSDGAADRGPAARSAEAPVGLGEGGRLAKVQLREQHAEPQAAEDATSSSSRRAGGVDAGALETQQRPERAAAVRREAQPRPSTPATDAFRWWEGSATDQPNSTLALLASRVWRAVSRLGLITSLGIAKPFKSGQLNSTMQDPAGNAQVEVKGHRTESHANAYRKWNLSSPQTDHLTQPGQHAWSGPLMMLLGSLLLSLLALICAAAALAISSKEELSGEASFQGFRGTLGARRPPIVTRRRSSPLSPWSAMPGYKLNSDELGPGDGGSRSAAPL